MNENISRAVWTYAISLILLGVIGYFVTGSQSVTALIPAFFGIVVLLILLIFGRFTKPKITLWILIVFSLIGFIATVKGVPKVFELLQGNDIQRPAAVISQTIMTGLSIVTSIVLIIKSKTIKT